jgi:putative lipoprotein
MKKHIILFVLLTTASHSWANDRSEDKLLNKDFNTGFVLPYSVIASQGTVNFTVVMKKEGFVQLAYECGNQNLWLTFVNTDQNYYPNGKPEYAEPKLITTKHATKLLQTEEIQSACKHNPDYRLVNDTVIDLNSIFADKEILNTVVFYPEKTVMRDIPHDNPYEFKAEYMVINCKNKQALLINGYDIYRNQVSDAGLVLMEHYPSDPKLIKAICQPNFAKKLPQYKFPKQWQVEPLAETASLSKKLIELVEPYQIEPPKRTINKIKFTGETVFEGQHKPLSETIIIKPTDTPNIFFVTVKIEDYKNESFGFLGEWQQLSRHTEFFRSKSQISSKLVQYFQNKLWQKAPVGTKFRYQRSYEDIRTMLGKDRNSHQAFCTITREIVANTLHKNIQGLAKEIQCTDPKDKYKRVDTGYYLLDYHYYVGLKTSPNKFFYSDKKIIEFNE